MRSGRLWLVLGRRYVRPWACWEGSYKAPLKWTLVSAPTSLRRRAISARSQRILYVCLGDSGPRDTVLSACKGSLLPTAMLVWPLTFKGVDYNLLGEEPLATTLLLCVCRITTHKSRSQSYISSAKTVLKLLMGESTVSSSLHVSRDPGDEYAQDLGRNALCVLQWRP